jgi:hypothetical protein
VSYQRVRDGRWNAFSLVEGVNTMNNDIRYSTDEKAEAFMIEPSSRTLASESVTEGQALVADWYEVIRIDPPNPSGSERQHGGWLTIRSLAAVLLAALLYPNQAAAADLRPETVKAWQEYVETAEARNQDHLAPGSPFLSIDAAPAQAAKLRQGEILASPATPHVPVKVQGGLIHDWIGAIFIQSASVRDVFRVIRHYGRYKPVYHPNVVSAKPLETSEYADSFSMVVMNKSFFVKNALDSDYHTVFTRLDDQHWYSITETTRVQEVADYGSPSQYMLPEGHGTGLIWGLYSIARYEERDGGVYIELEAIALSRDIPAALRWVVEPIVRRVARSSLVTSLRQTAEAVRSATTTISRSPDSLRPSGAISGSALNGSATTMRSFR